MPVPAHTRITWSGVFGGATAPIEVWAFNVNFGPQINATPENLATWATAARNAYSTNLAVLFSSGTVLTRTRVAAVGNDGLVQQTTDGQYIQADSLTQAAGSYSTVARDPMPLQAACAISLRTARAGAAGKGRFFLPWPNAYALGADHRFTAANAASIAGAAAAFLNAVRAGSAPAAGTNAVVASSKGFLSTVTGVRVGRAPDTMRSRRNALLEAYAEQTL